jgi:predicted RNase H-like HicB family nuclease
MSALAVESGTEFPLVHEMEGAPQRRFLAVVERGKSGWGAYVPDLPGVVAAADTEDGVRALIAEAVEFHLEGLSDADEPVPEPLSRALWVVG